MKAWLYTSTKPTLEACLKLNTSAKAPPTTLKPDQLYIQVISSALNPIDYKLVEIPGILYMLGTPGIPGLDYSGRVIAIGSEIDFVKPGDFVFGMLKGPIKFGSLGEYIVAEKAGTAALPAGIDFDDAAGIAAAGMTAYQSLKTFVKPGSKVFINGGSGGVGCYTIQIAKFLGAHVTTTCSAANVALCKSLGADEVIDYSTTDVVKTLSEGGVTFDHVVDNVGAPADLYSKSHAFLKPEGQFIQVGAGMTFSGIRGLMSNMMKPSMLGGGKSKFAFSSLKHSHEDLVQIGEWIKDGKVKPITDSVFEYADAPKSYEKLRTGRAKGKIIVHVTEKP